MTIDTSCMNETKTTTQQDATPCTRTHLTRTDKKALLLNLNNLQLRYSSPRREVQKAIPPPPAPDPDEDFTREKRSNSVHKSNSQLLNWSPVQKKHDRPKAASSQISIWIQSISDPSLRQTTASRCILYLFPFPTQISRDKEKGNTATPTSTPTIQQPTSHRASTARANINSVIPPMPVSARDRIEKIENVDQSSPRVESQDQNKFNNDLSGISEHSLLVNRIRLSWTPREASQISRSSPSQRRGLKQEMKNLSSIDRR
jgi:hypothetical protein